MVTANEDARMFINTAPPDSRQMHTVVPCYVETLMILRGPELSEDLVEIQECLSKEMST
jgi:hypothetical protein